MTNSQFKSHEKDEDSILDVQCFRGNWEVNADSQRGLWEELSLLATVAGQEHAVTLLTL